MGWLDTYWKKNDDPLKELDPSLRTFLEKEAPKRYQANDTSSHPEAPTYREQLGITDPTGPEARQRLQEAAKKAAELDSSGEEDRRPLPKESLFQDGRYKHLWKSYRPQGDIEEAGKSDQEKLMDIIGGFKERQAEVGRAAVANCADEQWLVQDCFRMGGWKSRMTMCRAENRQFTRCVEMQSRFLRALGYVTLVDRPDEETEKIQMHADMLYHRMLDHEKAVDDARQNAHPIPKMPSIAESIPKTNGQPRYKSAPVTFEDLPRDVQEKLSKEKFAGLEGLQLELAKRELDNYIAVNHDLIVRVNDRWNEEYRERRVREADGNARLGDVVKKYFDFRKYDDVDAPPAAATKTSSES